MTSATGRSDVGIEQSDIIAAYDDIDLCNALRSTIA